MQETNFFWLTLYCRWPWVQMMQNQQCSDSGPGDGEWCRNFLFYLFLSGTHCGFVLPPVLISVGNNMSLSFQSDSRLADRGFSATWEAVYPEDLSGKTPYIYSHLHTHTHTWDESCWFGCEPNHQQPCVSCEIFNACVPCGYFEVDIMRVE